MTIISRTVFDDVFRSICQNMPSLVVHLINEVFETNYSSEEPIIQLRNEHYVLKGKNITDSLVQIRSHTYHIECQSKDDTQMVIRMLEYDLSIALDSIVQLDDNTFQMAIPESAVVYLRKSESKSRNATCEIVLPDGRQIDYKMKTICVQDYDVDNIFEKELLMFLPFYILRYENDLPSGKANDKAKLEKMIVEYNNIFKRLEEYCGEDKEGLYTDLYNYSMKIINHVVRSRSIKRRLTDMGGHVIKLESERIYERGHDAGVAEGHAAGIAEAQNKQLLDVRQWYDEGLLPAEKVMEHTKRSITDFIEMTNKLMAQKKEQAT